jgi:hypothetical protein
MQHSLQWKSKSFPRPKKAQKSGLNVKTMRLVLFDYQNLVYNDFIPRGQTVKQEFYLDHFMVSIKDSAQEMMRTLVATQLVYSPKQCCCRHGTLCAEVSCEKQNSSGSTATLQL